MRTVSKCVVLIFTLTYVNCVPEYIKICALNDPDFPDCLLKHASKALPGVFKYGSDHFDIPELLPYALAKGGIRYTLAGPDDFTVELSDTDVVGFEKTKIKEFTMDLETNKFTFITELDYVGWLGHYQIKGKIFNKPIHGNGRSNFTFVGGTYTVKADITKIEIDGKQHFKLTNAESDFKNKMIYYEFDKLYGDNKNKGSEMQKKMIEEWKTVRDIMAPDTKRAIIGCYAEVFNTVFRKIPIEDMFNKQDDYNIVNLNN